MIGAYLAAWIAMTSAALGALIWIAVAETTSASFFLPVRRAAEAIAGTLPLCLVAFVPVAIFAGDLYPWPAGRPFFTHGPFVVRSFVYLGSWTAIAELHRRWSLEEREDDHRRRVLLAVSLPWILFTGTFAAFDWLMALDAGWVSHVYGAIFLVAGGTAAMAMLAYYAAREGVPAEHLHGLGNLLLTAVMLWGYLAFGQLLIQWIANVPHEITWYLRRTKGPWTAVAGALGILHLAIPFLMLLVRIIKRTPKTMRVLASVVLVGHGLDCALMVLPATHVTIVGVVAPLLWVAAFFVARFRYRNAPPVPARDRLLESSLRFEMPS